MDSTNIMSLLEQLDDEMDDLEESLSPLITTALSETAVKLPLLQKAKTFTLVTYAIESMIFSYLRLNGVKAREHPVFLELTRVKQYFDKIKAAETPKDRNLILDKSAAARVIKAGLSGNDKYDLQKAEREAKERARAHFRFEELSKKESKDEPVDKVEEEADSSDSESSAESSAEVGEESAPEPVAPPKKKGKKNRSDNSSSSGVSDKAVNSKAISKAGKKAARKAKHEKKKAKLLKKQKRSQS